MALTPFPADDPVWNTNGTNRTTPTTTKQAQGWVLNEAPPSSFFNWWMFYVSEYIQHYKTTAAYLENDKLSREGGVISGSYTFDFDQGYNIGSTTERLQTLFTGDVDAISLLPAAGVGGTTLGTTLRRWSEMFADEVNAFSASIAAISAETISANSVNATSITAGSAVSAPTVAASNVTASGNVTAFRAIVNEAVLFRGNRTSNGGIRQLDVTRATAVIDKQANVVFNDAAHVVKKSNIASITTSGSTCTVTLSIAQEDTKYGVEFTGCRELGTGNTDLVMIQVFNKTATTFDFIPYYWSGTNWTAMVMNTVNALAALRGVLRVVGSDV